ncbi:MULTISPECIES: hypothetical protein [Streptomyces]|uniref:hypothetical protein n=1 Tax=Streptomyces TaxID=1883 RepID=UPI0013A547F4|nr:MULTISPECIES: hypothetical protein [Streptomyces]
MPAGRPPVRSWDREVRALLVERGAPDRDPERDRELRLPGMSDEPGPAAAVVRPGGGRARAPRSVG